MPETHAVMDPLLAEVAKSAAEDAETRGFQLHSLPCASWRNQGPSPPHSRQVQALEPQLWGYVFVAILEEEN